MNARDLFEILVREQAPMLQVYLRCLLPASEVDDVLQETLVTAWRVLPRFDRTKPLGPWLRGIARHVAFAHQRKLNQAHTYDPSWFHSLEERFAALHRQTGDTLDEKLQGLRDCIEQLPEPYREAIRLRYQQELTGETLATRLQINLENLKKRLQRGKQWLVECLTKKLQTEERWA